MSRSRFTPEEREEREAHREWREFGDMWEDAAKRSATCSECGWFRRDPDSIGVCTNPGSVNYTETTGRFGSCGEWEE